MPKAVEYLKRGDTEVAASCVRAITFWTRFWGWMGKRNFLTSEAIYFPRCKSIHTFFMLVPIDVVFVDASGRIVELCLNVLPWRLLMPRWSAFGIVELQSGTVRKLGLTVGDRLEWGEKTNVG